MRTRLTDKIYVFEEVPRQAGPTSRTPLLASEHRRQEEEEESLCSQILLVLVFFVFFVSICLIGVWTGGRWVRSTERICTGYISQYSPVLEDLSLSYTTMGFNGSLLQPNKYRQDAGREVDAAWNDLGINYRDIKIPATLAARSGITTDHVKINEKYGGGYPANLEGLTHLHCLNLLRQGLWYNYDYHQKRGEGAFENDIPILKLHISRCQDFNTNHKCRDFDAVKDWAQQRQMPAEFPADFLQQPEEGDTVYSAYQ